MPTLDRAKLIHKALKNRQVNSGSFTPHIVSPIILYIYIGVTSHVRAVIRPD